MSTQGFKLEQLFGSKTRARLLGLFLEDPNQAYYVRELTRKIDAQLNSVRRELKNLVDLGFVLEKNAPAKEGEKKSAADKKKYYAANPESIMFDDLSSLFKKVKIMMRQNLVDEIADKGDIFYFAFMGRFIDEVDAPTDLIIVGDIVQKNLSGAISAFEQEMGEEINFTLMPKDEFNYRRQLTDKFLFSILESEKVVMINRLNI